jgi:hypothetical protein
MEAALRDLMVTTLHAEIDDFPWIAINEGQELKVLQVRPSQDLIVVHLRAKPFFVGGLHKHIGFTFGYTTKGAWSHSVKEFPYKPHSYVCEPINELHRFCNGPEVSEAFYITIGKQEYYDERGKEVIRRNTPESLLAMYYQKCEEAGLRRPNVLS